MRGERQLFTHASYVWVSARGCEAQRSGTQSREQRRRVVLERRRCASAEESSPEVCACSGHTCFQPCIVCPDKSQSRALCQTQRRSLQWAGRRCAGGGLQRSEQQQKPVAGACHRRQPARSRRNPGDSEQHQLAPLPTTGKPVVTNMLQVPALACHPTGGWCLTGRE